MHDKFLGEIKLPERLDPLERLRLKSPAALLATALVVFGLAPSVRGALPVVVMAPPSLEKGQGIRDLFEHPAEWTETRGLINQLLLSDHELGKKNFSDKELRSWLDELRVWHLPLELDTGAIKEWGVTGVGTFEKERRNWDRVVQLGGSIDSIEMDEPLGCVRHYLKPQRSDEYAVQETANFVAVVRKNFPKVKIIEIETYPSLSVQENEWWIDALQKKLAAMKVRGIDGYRLDVNWVVFTLQNRGSWADVARIQNFCHTRSLPFGLIYWAPAVPVAKVLGLDEQSAWYIQVLEEGYEYAMVTKWFSHPGPPTPSPHREDGPDQYVIEDWVHAPKQVIPETADFSFTRSVRDFVTRFVQ
jgi:hypothetical protein